MAAQRDGGNMFKTIWLDFKNVLVQVRNVLCLSFLFHKKTPAIKIEEKIISPEDEMTELMSFSLEPVKEFLEEFIGIAIINFKRYDDAISDLDSFVQKKIISGVELEEQVIWVKLSNFNGKDGGYLKIAPSIVGEFASIGSDDEIMDRTLYRLNFFGGSCLEYLDNKTDKVISYQHKKKG